MRLTIAAGSILGASLAVQSMLGAHARAKASPAANAVHVHVHEVAPWYIANDAVPGAPHLAERAQASDEPDSGAAHSFVHPDVASIASGRPGS